MYEDDVDSTRRTTKVIRTHLGVCEEVFLLLPVLGWAYVYTRTRLHPNRGVTLTLRDPDVAYGAGMFCCSERPAMLTKAPLRE